MDLIDLADPIRLLVMLLPERYRGGAALLITTLTTLVSAASIITAKLPASAAQHPRWGRAVRVLHWLSLLRFRNEMGTVKAPGGEVAPRVEVATLPTSPLRAVTVSHRPPPPAESGCMSVEVAGAVLLACVIALGVGTVGAVIVGCPNWNRPVCGAPGVYSCANDQPAVCSPTGELTPIGDEACGAQGRVCAVRADGVAYCARAADGGAQ